MRVKITPPTQKQHMEQGGMFNATPYAGDVSRASIVINPFGLIKSNVENLDTNINHSIKPVDKDKANAEYEKGETVLKFDLGGMYKVLGKPHSQGGTPTIADGGDFVFSNDKDLAITKNEKKMFKFKEGGSNAKGENTPAEILGKEVDVKHYNKMVSLLKSSQADDISKGTAQLMLQKYLEKAGQVAYLQEAKKNFPQGMPTFSENTAPTEQEGLKDVDVKEKMYSKKGGMIPHFQTGGTLDFMNYNAFNPFMPNPFVTHKLDDVTVRSSGRRRGNNGNMNTSTDVDPNPQQLFTPYWSGNMIQNPQDFVMPPATRDHSNPSLLSPQHRLAAGTFGSTPDVNEFRQRQAWYMQNHPNFNPSNPSDVANFQQSYNQEAAQRGYRPYFTGSDFRGIDSKFGQYTYNAPGFAQQGAPQTPPDRTLPYTNNSAPQQPGTPFGPNNFTSFPTQAFDGFNIGMNGLEKTSVALPFLTAFAQPTYYDMLSQKYTPPIRLDRVSNQQELNDIGQQGSLAQREMYSNMPGAQASQNAAAAIARTIGARGQSNAAARNANTQIANQEALTNWNAMRDDENFNVNNIHQTYNNNVRARQFRNEELANGTAQSFNNASSIQRNLDTLNQSMTAAVLPYLTNAYYDKSGNLVGQGSYSDLSDDQKRRVASAKQVAPVGLSSNRLPYATGFGSLNSVPGQQGQGVNMIMGLAKQYISAGASPDAAIRSAAYAFGQMYRPNAKGNSAIEEMLGNMYRNIPPQQ